MSSDNYHPEDDLSQFDDVARALSMGPTEVVPEQPSEDLWAAISQSLAGPEEVNPSSAPHSAPQLASHSAQGVEGSRSLAGDDVGVARGAQQPYSNVIPISRGRQKKSKAFIASVFGAAAGLILLVAVPLGLAWRSNQTTPVELAAQLDELGEFDGAGSARLVEGRLEVEVEALPDRGNGQYYEIWAIRLVAGEIEGIVSLGRIDGSGTFGWPEGIDPADYSVVDISIEKEDGDKTHSGNSILQGELAQPK